MGVSFLVAEVTRETPTTGNLVQLRFGEGAKPIVGGKRVKLGAHLGQELMKRRFPLPHLVRLLLAMNAVCTKKY
jgi:hypothetical protein